MEFSHSRGCVYGLEYHIVWCVKYRRKVISETVGARLDELVQASASSHGAQVLELNWCEDHVHVLVRATPYTSLPNLVRSMKGSSARILFQEFPQIKKKLWGGHLWNPSYFIATVSENTEEQIAKYIQNQRR